MDDHRFRSLAAQSLVTKAALLFSILIFGAVGFQMALVAGVPWGEYAWGGKYPGVLPDEMRVASIGSAFILIALGVIIYVRSNARLLARFPYTRKLAWIVVGYSALGVVANAATPSAGERMIWLPVTILMVVCSLIVARSNNESNWSA